MEITTITTIAATLLVLVALAAVLWYIHAKRTLGAARRAIDESAGRLEFILRSSAIGVWSWDAQRDAVTADTTCSQLFGFPAGHFPRDLAGFLGLVHPDDSAQMQAAVARAMELGAEYKLSFRTVWPDGTIRYLAVRARFEYDNEGKPLRLTGVTLDVTEQTLSAEELRIANEKLRDSLTELDQQSREDALLAQLSDLLQSCGDSAEAHELIALFSGRLFSECAGALFLFSASRNVLQSVTTWNDPLIDAPDFGPDDCWALRRGQPHFVDPQALAATCRHLKGVQRPGHACIPLMAQGTGLGVLYLQSPEAWAAPQFLSDSTRKLCTTVAKDVSLTLANLHLREALRIQSIRDPLTGLFNRRYLEDSLERELHRMTRKKHPAGLVMVDIDHFKRFNDIFGHEGGDAVLRAFGGFLTERLRTEDIACRYGGEEFCLVLGESSLEDTERRCEQLRSEVKQLLVQHGGKQLPPIAISVGIACFPTHGTTVTALISAADAALYRAKAGGRDRVAVAPVAETLSAE